MHQSISRTRIRSGKSTKYSVLSGITYPLPCQNSSSNTIYLILYSVLVKLKILSAIYVHLTCAAVFRATVSHCRLSNILLINLPHLQFSCAFVFLNDVQYVSVKLSDDMKAGSFKKDTKVTGSVKILYHCRLWWRLFEP